METALHYNGPLVFCILQLQSHTHQRLWVTHFHYSILFTLIPIASTVDSLNFIAAVCALILQLIVVSSFNESQNTVCLRNKWPTKRITNNVQEFNRIKSSIRPVSILTILVPSFSSSASHCRLIRSAYEIRIISRSSVSYYNVDILSLKICLRMNTYYYIEIYIIYEWLSCKEDHVNSKCEDKEDIFLTLF